MNDIKNFDSLMIKLASQEQIKEWSYGEVNKPETINYRTLRPEKEGLFCEKIFGTTKEWECFCGKFKSIRYKGVVCDRCGVEVTHFKVRRERMGHIKLATPVSHIWFYRSVPSRMGLLLDLSVSTLRSVLYYEKFIVVEPGGTDLKKLDLLTEEEYVEARERYESNFVAEIGAEAIKILLRQIDLDLLASELRQRMIEKRSSDKKLLKRVEIVEHFRKSASRPEWMVMDVIPVIPPDLRPMVQLDGGRFATSDLNDLYRRVINRNNRLFRMQKLNAPDIIIRNEKRMLQEAVDALFDNSKKKKVVKGSSNRPLKSLSDFLKGKQGRFRQNLLGKRVDYSGRSVVVVGPSLKLHQCGLPSRMALELYKPFIMRSLIENEIASNIKRAKTIVENEETAVWEILEMIVREHPILLNRAPTLHRLSVQAFEPVLIDGKAIRLHPLVCHAFNADFDGDQMAVHVPLTEAAQMECWTLMLSSRNLFNPANGQPVVFPSQDMVLGLYSLTSIRKGAKGENSLFSDFDEAVMAAETKSVSDQALVRVIQEDNTVLETTPGRIKLNLDLNEGVEFVNEVLSEKAIRNLIDRTFTAKGAGVVVELLNNLKNVGFRYATTFGCSIGVDDMMIPDEKTDLIQTANEEVQKIKEQQETGIITSEEKHNKIVEVWSDTNERLTDTMMQSLQKDKEGFNNVYMMADSGARGSRNQIRQLAGMRGLMAKPSGDIIELPIRSNFKEGLSVIEFFISTNGARKGLADTALKTADAGYLTRRLADIAQDVVINENDCGTINGIHITALKDGEEIVESLSDRIRGAFTLERIKHPITKELVLDLNEEITDEVASELEHLGVEGVTVRTVFTCEAKHGVCQKCYGRNLASRKTVDIGEAVGIIAAQSIGQPGTQLTMRTFHVGGTASTSSEGNSLFMKMPIVITEIVGTTIIKGENPLFTRKGYLKYNRVIGEFRLSKGEEISLVNGDRVAKNEVLYVTTKGEEIKAQEAGFIRIQRKNRFLLVGQEQRIEMRTGSALEVALNTVILPEQTIATYDPYSEPIIAEVEGKVVFADMIPESSITSEINSHTGQIEVRVTTNTSDTLEPRLLVRKGKKEECYYLPVNAIVAVQEGATVEAGAVLARIPKSTAKTQDITGGLPRVVELFEARRPSVIAILAQVSGVVHFAGRNKGNRVLEIEDSFGNRFKHLVPLGRYLLARDGDNVEYGEPLCDGQMDPHQILTIKGENELQRFLLDEVQEVYRMQGVEVNDKHIGVIIRQMMRKVEILEVGDTSFIYEQVIDKYNFFEENRRVMEAGGQPAIAKPLLQSITRASLSIDSWISAASFQETTKVLTNASIAGKVDQLRGLKENVIIGHIIPAGTGIVQYSGVTVEDSREKENKEVSLEEESDSVEENTPLSS